MPGDKLEQKLEKIDCVRTSRGRASNNRSPARPSPPNRGHVLTFFVILYNPLSHFISPTRRDLVWNWSGTGPSN